jgi:hypothetical protein
MFNLKKNKPKINLIIDAIMLIVFMAVAGLGFLIKYILLPGYKINELYDSNTELFFWGLNRHQWGTIHLYLAFSLILLMILHIIFHWGMITCIFRQLIPGPTARIIISVFIGVLAIFLALGPLYVKPEIVQLQRKHNRNRVYEIPSPYSLSSPPENKLQDESALPAPETAVNKEEMVDSHNNHNRLDINGTMTLDEISVKYSINIEELARTINIPVKYANERLGRLRKRYGFHMDDIREYIINNSAVEDK